jgi:hypothetical protein
MITIRLIIAASMGTGMFTDGVFLCERHFRSMAKCERAAEAYQRENLGAYCLTMKPVWLDPKQWNEKNR